MGRKAWDNQCLQSMGRIARVSKEFSREEKKVVREDEGHHICFPKEVEEAVRAKMSFEGKMGHLLFF